jgi:hypothetical protein
LWRFTATSTAVGVGSADGAIVAPQDNSTCQQVSVHGCQVIGGYGSLVASQVMDDPQTHAGISVTDNYAANLTGAAIHCTGWADSRITGNTIIDCWRGVWLDRGDTSGPVGRVLIDRNTILRCTDTPILSPSDPYDLNITDLSIIGNNVDTTAGAASGIQLADIAPLLVKGNRVTGVGGSGVVLTDCPAALVDGNTVNAGQVGVKINFGGMGTCVRDNRIASTAAGATAINIAATGCSAIGNDAGGNGWTAAAFVLDPTTVTAYDGGTTVPGNNLVS